MYDSYRTFRLVLPAGASLQKTSGFATGGFFTITYAAAVEGSKGCGIPDAVGDVSAAGSSLTQTVGCRVCIEPGGTQEA